jgi:hypothetical protein
VSRPREQRGVVTRRGATDFVDVVADVEAGSSTQSDRPHPAECGSALPEPSYRVGAYTDAVADGGEFHQVGCAGPLDDR